MPKKKNCPQEKKTVIIEKWQWEKRKIWWKYKIEPNRANSVENLTKILNKKSYVIPTWIFKNHLKLSITGLVILKMYNQIHCYWKHFK